MTKVPRKTLEELLAAAHEVVVWTTQDTIKYDSAGGKHLLSARRRYMKARIDTLAKVRPLSPIDFGGCTCGWHKSTDHKINPDCLYHYAARLQPDNHRIPWNCPTYYDGCNCEEDRR